MTRRLTDTEVNRLTHALTVAGQKYKENAAFMIDEAEREKAHGRVNLARHCVLLAETFTAQVGEAAALLTLIGEHDVVELSANEDHYPMEHTRECESCGKPYNDGQDGICDACIVASLDDRARQGLGLPNASEHDDTPSLCDAMETER